ncbi:metallophosphoesterase [Candidatus Pacearchaeota archaeon]|nr:metallophosphoesterase [Candidatus Pacearchaeota archaeon]
MNILFIGDPHGNKKCVPVHVLRESDLIIFTGDLGNADMARKYFFKNIERKKKGLSPIILSARDKKRIFMQSYTSSLEVIDYLRKFAPVYTIYGNVESTNSETREYSREIGMPLPFLADSLKKRGVSIINNKLVRAGKVRIGGLQYFTDISWIKTFKGNKDRKITMEAKKESKAKSKTLRAFGKIDVLVCHQPPYGILDKIYGRHLPKSWIGKHAGSKVIREYVNKYQPEYVICGHIHEGKGAVKSGRTKIYNLGSCGYKLILFR